MRYSRRVLPAWCTSCGSFEVGAPFFRGGGLALHHSSKILNIPTGSMILRLKLRRRWQFLSSVTRRHGSSSSSSNKWKTRRGRERRSNRSIRRLEYPCALSAAGRRFVLSNDETHVRKRFGMRERSLDCAGTIVVVALQRCSRISPATE